MLIKEFDYYVNRNLDTNELSILENDLTEEEAQELCKIHEKEYFRGGCS